LIHRRSHLPARPHFAAGLIERPPRLSERPKTGF
jgi:hypothetical protein